ncbi:MAG: tetratricopeptide repeat protein [Planctomycetota bacterium]|jgi:tetratricopeptide (TPR) repeat protein
MSRLLEILGRAIAVDTADLIWHWLDTVKLPEDDREPAQHQQLANIIELIGSGKTQAAEDLLKLYLFDNPSCARGRLAAAAICLSDSRLQDAIEQLKSVYVRQPNNTMALYALGHCHERLGQEAQAVEFYQDCLKFKNYLHLPRQRLAAVYFKNAQLEKTIQEYELLKDEYPDDVSTLVTLGHLYVAKTEYDKAREKFDTAILIHPDNFHTEGDHIDQLIRNGQLYEALEQLEQMMTDQPDRADLHLKRADVLSALGDDCEAVHQYQEVLRLCPDFLEATIKLGTQYLQMHHERLAAQQFNRAAEINDQVVDAYIGLAITQKLAGNLEEASTTLSLAAAIQPNSSLLFAETATLQFKVGLGQRSASYDTGSSQNLMPTVIQAHQQHINQRPQNPDLHYRLAILLMTAGNIDQAVKAFQTALEINPTYTRARTKLAVCLFETGRPELAMDQLVVPEPLDKDTLLLHYKTALLYCDKPKFASSLMNLERSLEDNFASPDAVVNIAVVLQNLGLMDRASAMWESLCDTTGHAINANYPDSPDEILGA